MLIRSWNMQVNYVPQAINQYITAVIGTKRLSMDGRSKLMHVAYCAARLGSFLLKEMEQSYKAIMAWRRSLKLHSPKGSLLDRMIKLSTNDIIHLGSWS